MNDEKSPASLEQMFARLEDDCDAIRPYFIEEIKENLKSRSIDTALPMEIKKLLEQANSKRAILSAAASPPHVQGVVEGVRESLASAAWAGKKIADHVQETANVLAAGLADFLVASPFGRLQAVSMRGGSGAETSLKLRIPTLGVRVTFRLKDARGEKVFATVVSLKDSKDSHILDDGVVVASGNIVGRFADGNAEFAARALAGQIGLRDSQGMPLETVVENAS